MRNVFVATRLCRLFGFPGNIRELCDCCFEGYQSLRRHLSGLVITVLRLLELQR